MTALAEVAASGVEPLGSTFASLSGAATVFAGARAVMQPIVSLSTGTVLAVEALTRFDDPFSRGPQEVFRTAHAAGYGVALEARCIRAALRLRSQLPAGTLLSVNVHPDVVRAYTGAGYWPADLRGVILEVTEQGVRDPAALRTDVARVRALGAAIAVDDVSTGYAGLLRLAELRPDYVKIDRQVVAGVGDSIAQSAVLEALVTLSHRLGAAVIAEGVENLADLRTLCEFDVDYVQGFAIGRPAAGLEPIDAAVVEACRTGRERLLARTLVGGEAAARTRDVYSVTAALAAAGDRSDVTAVIWAAAAELGVDVIAVSIVGVDDALRVVSIHGADFDDEAYALAYYPTTRDAMREGRTIEIHADDPSADPREVGVLRQGGFTSLLLSPIRVDGRGVGIIEFMQRSQRRWSAQDIAHAQGLSDHLGPALRRLGVGSIRGD